MTAVASMTSLVDQLIAHRQRAAVPPAERLRAADILAEMLDQCAQAWPTLEVSPAEFAAYLAQRLAPDAPLDDALRGVHAEELFIACACASGQSSAVKQLQRRYGSHMDGVLASFGPNAAAREDLRQIVLHHLFVSAPGQPPFIASYAGQGSLAAWLRVVTKRVALNATRKKDPLRRATADEDLMELPNALRDPELDYLKSAYRTAFREAFAVAAAALTARQRTLLKQSIVRALNVRQLATMYNVHHATAARWLATARAELIENTRRELGLRLNIPPSELQSVMGLIQSRLDVTVSRLFREP